MNWCWFSESENGQGRFHIQGFVVGEVVQKLSTKWDKSQSEYGVSGEWVRETVGSGFVVWGFALSV